MKKKIIIIFLITVIILLGGIGYRKFKQRKSSQEKKGEEIFPVETTSARKGTIQKTISLTGDVSPENEVTVFSEVTGTLKKIYVEEGDRVRKGELLIKIDDKNIRLQLQASQEALHQTEVNLANTEKNYVRMKNLFKEDVITPYEMDQIQARKDVALAQVKQLKAQANLAKERLSRCKIYSPINGIVAKRFLDAGELITASSMMKNAPLLLIQNLKTVKIKVSAGERELGKIKKGQEVRIKVDAYPDRIFAGKVSEIGSFVEPTSRTVEIEIKVKNTDYFLKSGMFVRVEIITQEKKNSLLIPNETIFGGSSRVYSAVEQARPLQKIFIVKNNKAYIREVKTGLKDAEKTEILEGLQEGDLVVTAGAQRLKNGVRVKITK